MIDTVLCFSDPGKTFYKKTVAVLNSTFAFTKKNLGTYIIRAKSLTDEQKTEIAQAVRRVKTVIFFTTSELSASIVCAARKQ